MHKTLNGKGYIKDGGGVFVTGAGEVYAYHDGELTPLTVADDAFKGITPPWPRKTIKDGSPIEGVESAWRKAYILKEP